MNSYQEPKDYLKNKLDYSMLRETNNKEIGCTQCPYAGHIELKECPDAYTEASKHCRLYNHDPIA